MTGRFESKVVIVTGGASGLGKDASLAFAREGAKVVVGDVADGGETVSRIKEAGGEAAFVPTDVSKATDVENMVDECVRLYGGLDCAFNSAGIGEDLPCLPTMIPQAGKESSP